MPELIPEWTPITSPPTQQQLDALGRFAFQIRRLLSGKLTVDNQRAQWLDVVIQWPTTQVPSVRTNPLLGTRPKSVTLADCRIGESSTTPASLAATLEWDWSAGSILLPQFTNGTLTTRWQLRLLVMEA